jgi:hypothetical protein
MMEAEIVLKHEMPIIWHILCLAGSAACLIGSFTGHIYITIPGLLITIPCLIWYAVNKYRLRRLARRIQG